MNTTNETQSTLEPQSSAQLEEMRRQLAGLPPDVLERAHHALMHGTIPEAGNLLYKAGLCFGSAELYEYRQTLFPSGALVAPYTAGPPVLRPGAEEREKEDRSADSLSASELATDHGPRTTDHGHLLTDLRDLLRRHVVLPEMGAEALALWVVHTYAFSLRQVTTYIGLVSPEKRCGKTTLLELLRRLANRAVAVANITPSALFRAIEETQPTLLIDEADTFLQGRDEIAGILNAGYRRDNAYVVRVADRKKRRKTEPAPKPAFGEWTTHENGGQSAGGTEFAQYSCWCPKVMAAIGRLPDTLADRCIVITMQRKLPGEQCERMRNLDATEYRVRCAEFVREHGGAIAQASPEIPAALNDRAADIWEPLLAIADLAGGEWPQLARHAALKLSTFEDETTLIGHFLKDLRDWMTFKKVDRMLSRDIVTAFNPSHNRPWEDLRRGREINEWWLSQRMKDLGIRPEPSALARPSPKAICWPMWRRRVAGICRAPSPPADRRRRQNRRRRRMMTTTAPSAGGVGRSAGACLPPKRRYKFNNRGFPQENRGFKVQHKLQQHPTC